MALMLGGMAIAIIGFATKSGISPVPGLVLLPVAICFVIHALRQSAARRPREGRDAPPPPDAAAARYYVRARAIRRREPGPYEDKNGPVALAVVLAVAAASNVLIHLALE